MKLLNVFNIKSLCANRNLILKLDCISTEKFKFSNVRNLIKSLSFEVSEMSTHKRKHFISKDLFRNANNDP